MEAQVVLGPQGVQVVNKVICESVGRFDIISALLLEISTMIFRMLDPCTMQAVQLVSKRWYKIYHSDPMMKRILRRRVRQQIREKNLLARYGSVTQS